LIFQVAGSDCKAPQEAAKYYGRQIRIGFPARDRKKHEVRVIGNQLLSVNIDMPVFPHEPAIDEIADHFDAEWRSGSRPSLAEALNLAHSEESRMRLLQLLAPIELEYRLARGEQPELFEYQELPSLSEEELIWLRQYISDLPRQPSNEVQAEAIKFANPQQANPSNDVALIHLRSEEGQTGVASNNRGEITAVSAEPLQDTTKPFIPNLLGPWRVGDIRGDYEILSELGKGGMGTVFKARHCRLKRLVALKRIRMRFDEDETAIARFRREIEAIGRLPVNPHTVLATDAREIDGVLCLIMECVDGLDLGSLVKGTGPLSAPDVVEIARQTAIGLDHIHQHGLIHRDIKPTNLLVASNGMVKIVDLGLARLNVENSHELTQVGFAMGTADYMAPEQWENASSVGVHADLYSLGCTLYFLLTGQPPFQAEKDLFAKREAHLHKTPLPLENIRPELPPALVQIVESLLEKSVVSRFASAPALLGSLSELSRSGDLRDLLQQTGKAVSETSLADTSRIYLEQTKSIRPIGDEQNIPARSRNGWKSFLNSRNWLVAAGTFIALTVVIAATLIYYRSSTSVQSDHPSTSRSLTDLPNSGDNAAIAVTELDLWIRRQRDDNSIKHFRLVDEGATSVEAELPALVGNDDFNLRVALSRACHWRLVWLDTRGKAAVVAQSNTTSDLIRYPSEREMVTVDAEDPSGAHLLIVVASSSENAFGDDSWIKQFNDLGPPPQTAMAIHGSTRGAGAISDTKVRFAADYFEKIQGRLPQQTRFVQAVQIRSSFTGSMKEKAE
jgi:serine/threonine protein kinase